MPFFLRRWNRKVS
uniref:5-methyltetrahydropteroyltriglutamatehomocysteine methyltransferase n=1 Tax=Rhizophora mucronata TaxID=61149 RepID=A0A2P2NME4_RHIMU